VERPGLVSCVQLLADSGRSPSGRVNTIGRGIARSGRSARQPDGREPRSPASRAVLERRERYGGHEYFTQLDLLYAHAGRIPMQSQPESPDGPDLNSMARASCVSSRGRHAFLAAQDGKADDESSVAKRRLRAQWPDNAQ